MSLLLVAIVHDSDADRVADSLRQTEHRATRIPSFGGFLGTANTTLLIGAEEQDEAAIVEIFRRECSGREVEVPLVMLERLRDVSPRMVSYAGATIFVVDLRRVIRV